MNLKQKLSKKLKKSGGFTLIEMLIVVAIIAILIAVSIPLVSGSLNKARKATDAANERAAKAAAIITYMTDDDFDPDTTYYYDAVEGDLKSTDGATPQAYGQCSDHKGGYITVKIDVDGNITTLEWGGSATSKDLDSSELMTGD